MLNSPSRGRSARHPCKAPVQGRWLLRQLALYLSLLLLSACASLDFDQPREPSYALPDTRDTPIARKVIPAVEQQGGRSGFRVLHDGIEALAARILLMGSATRSIDAQYYFVLDDMTGNLFIRELLSAADRGVRVRLLIDDIATQGYDEGMLALNAHPNFEIRIFNPFSQRTGRYLNVFDYARVNRRMHNKSLTIDNQIMIVGGRNIGDEYFSARKDMNFADLDVVGYGPVARETSAVFDQYWNDRHTLPVTALIEPLDDPEESLSLFRDRIDAALLKIEETPYADAFLLTSLDMIKLDPQSIRWVPHQLISDAPGKAWKDTDSDQNMVLKLKEVIDRAQREFILVSPYFVPRKQGVEVFRQLRNRGVEVHVLTNSLASTDVKAVHSGYAAARKSLLEMGVNLYEVRADARVKGTRRSRLGGSRASLHTKGFIVDQNTVFVGSFNFDPRSAFINTEMGVLLEAPELANYLSEGFSRFAKRGRDAYQLRLDENRRIRWLDRRGDEVVELDKEPQTNFWDRFVVGFMRMLPIKGQL